MSKPYKFPFYLGDTVQIIELSRPGRIVAILINEFGVKYAVRYFQNGDLKECYFYQDEFIKKEP